MIAAAAAKSLQSCPTLCDPIDSSPPGSPVPGILQTRTLEWVAISFSNAWKWRVKVKLLSRVWLFATPWTAAHQAPLSMGFSRQEYWSGVLHHGVIVELLSLLASPHPHLLGWVLGSLPPNKGRSPGTVNGIAFSLGTPRTSNKIDKGKASHKFKVFIF